MEFRGIQVMCGDRSAGTSWKKKKQNTNKDAACYKEAQVYLKPGRLGFLNLTSRNKSQLIAATTV